ncbi:MAG: DUF2190 family protein [Thermoplasmata archaeon]
MAILRGALQSSKLINYEITSNVAKGDILQINDVVGVALQDGVAGENIPFIIEADIVEFDCDLDNYSAGEKIYLDSSTKKVNKNNAGIPVGYVYESKANATKIDVVFKQ